MIIWELWPNFIRMASQQGAVVLVGNARMTEKSLRWYSKVKVLFREMLKSVYAVAAQSDEDAQRYAALGMPLSRLKVLGNTKFDVSALAELGLIKAQAFRKSLALKDKALLIIAGSTRPGEEARLLNVFVNIKASHPEAVLMLAPRHLNRLDEVRRLAEKFSFVVSTRRGLQQNRDKSSSVILLDSMGELAWAYAAADLVWMGGSFEAFGGQNPLEPAAHGVALIIGPHMENFKEASAFLTSENAAVQIQDDGQLLKESQHLLKNKEARLALGKQAAQCLKIKAGASQKLADLAVKLLMITDLKSHSEDWRAESLHRQATTTEFGDSLDQPEL